jgi:hypothetical protein
MAKNAAEIAQEFGLPEEMLLLAAKKAFEQYMQAGLYRKALRTAVKYNLPEEMKSEAMKKVS